MKLAAKLDDLIAENPYPISYSNNYDRRGALISKNGLTVIDKHIDVCEEEGYITIPRKELPEGWIEQSDMLQLKSLDRPFVFPGEQIHILACLSAFKQEEYTRQTEELLTRFKNSHFFARLCEADEALWSRRKTQETFQGSKSEIEGRFIPIESSNDDASVDRGSLEASTSGGVAKNDVKCSLLANGDIVVRLQVNIGVDFLKDPVLEILQFEKYESSGYSEHDPYGDLLKWLLPIHNSVSPPLFLSPLETSPGSSARSSLTKPNSPSSFGSQNFLLGQFRSHSMTSISSKSIPSFSSLLASSSGSERNGEGLLSFRGVPLEPERFSIRCGLEGIYIPGRRWRRKIEIIQPLQIHCFAVDCNTEDLLSVQIKNVSPVHAPDIVIYLDAITLIFEEASKEGSPLSLPIACVETGNNHGLPDLPLRKGQEHSFILKPATPLWSCNAQGEMSALSSAIFSNVNRGVSPTSKYVVLVSCRCNYTESRLLFKQPTNWRPHIQKGILVSVASQMSRKMLRPDDKIPNLPVQVVTLEASNVSNEDLTLTLLAPPSLTYPSVVSLTCSPRSPMSPIDDRQNIDVLPRNDLGYTSGSFNEKMFAISDVLPRSDLGHTHMWLKSRVPLGCVPSQSRVTVKLELLPLTDGIITLDSLQINVEKGGLSYIPEHPLKINAMSSIHIGALK